MPCPPHDAAGRRAIEIDTSLAGACGSNHDRGGAAARRDLADRTPVLDRHSFDFVRPPLQKHRTRVSATSWSEVFPEAANLACIVEAECVVCLDADLVVGIGIGCELGTAATSPPLFGRLDEFSPDA